MFLIGSLTTILPYLGTLFLMVVFHFVAIPNHENLSQTSFNQEKSIEYTQDSPDDITSAYANFDFEKSASHMHTQPLIEGKDTFSDYQAPLLHPYFGKTFGNKAPPHLL